MRSLWFAILLLLISASELFSQSGVPSVVAVVRGEAMGLIGEIGSYGEYVSISGRDAGRPSS